jgi:hypothetical protein
MTKPTLNQSVSLVAAAMTAVNLVEKKTTPPDVLAELYENLDDPIKREGVICYIIMVLALTGADHLADEFIVAHMNVLIARAKEKEKA